MLSAPSRVAAGVIGAALLSACASDVPLVAPSALMTASLSPAGGKADVCHHPAKGGQILEIGLAGLAGHLAHATMSPRCS